MKALLFLLTVLSATLGNATTPCPPGFSDTGSHCIKPPSYGRGVGNRTMARCELEHGAGNCEKCLSLYFPYCEESYAPRGCNVCEPFCPAGMTDVGLMCQK